MENKDFSKHIKKAKLRSNLKTIGIVLSVFIVLMMIFVFFNINNAIIDSMKDERDSYYIFNHLCGPNLYLGKETKNRRFLAEKKTATLYKLIEGIPVFVGEKEFFRGLNFDGYTKDGTCSPLLLANSWSESDTKNYRYDIYGNREMVFYYPCVKYNYLRNDIQNLNKVRDDKYIEMAISFDDYYAIEDVKKLLPKNITIAWYWVDTDSSEDKKDFSKQMKNHDIVDGKEVITHYYDPKVCSEHIAYGIKAYENDGSTYETTKPEELFLAVLENNYNKDYVFEKYKNEMKRIYNNLIGEDKKLTIEDIKIQGIVVTGDREELKALEELKFVRASSIGVTVDKY